MRPDYAKMAEAEHREFLKWDAAARDPKYANSPRLIVLQKTAEGHRRCAELFAERAARQTAREATNAR